MHGDCGKSYFPQQEPSRYNFRSGFSENNGFTFVRGNLSTLRFGTL